VNFLGKNTHRRHKLLLLLLLLLLQMAVIAAAAAAAAAGCLLPDVEAQNLSLKAITAILTDLHDTKMTCVVLFCQVYVTCWMWRRHT
jgi:hypothetical protein